MYNVLPGTYSKHIKLLENNSEYRMGVNLLTLNLNGKVYNVSENPLLASSRQTPHVRSLSGGYTQNIDIPRVP